MTAGKAQWLPQFQVECYLEAFCADLIILSSGFLLISSNPQENKAELAGLINFISGKWNRQGDFHMSPGNSQVTHEFVSILGAHT